MNNENEQQPFDEVLDELFTDDPLPIHSLHRLSDMTAEEHETFRRRWTAVDPERRRVIVRHLVDLTEDNFTVDFVPVFADCFSDPEPAVRVAALDGVWDTTETRIIPAIIRLLQEDKNEEVRAAAASALAHYIVLAEWGQLPGKTAVPIVEALLAVYDDMDTAVLIRRAALEALGSAHHPRIPDLISEAYESRDEGLQISAVFAMGAGADKRWLAIVMAEMENINPEMRVEAARAAGNLGSSDAVEYLEKLLDDEDLEVQIAAVSALGQIGGDNVQETLLELAQNLEYEELFDAIEEALEEMALFAGEFQLLDYKDDEEDDLDDDPLLI